MYFIISRLNDQMGRVVPLAFLCDMVKTDVEFLFIGPSDHEFV
jgi:hypothetical protein